MTEDGSFFEDAEEQMRPERQHQMVLLRGGPMDGDTVNPDAACLRPNWYKSLPDRAAEQFGPGLYEIIGKETVGDVEIGDVAEWHTLNR